MSRSRPDERRAEGVRGIPSEPDGFKCLYSILLVFQKLPCLFDFPLRNDYLMYIFCLAISKFLTFSSGRNAEGAPTHSMVGGDTIVTSLTTDNSFTRQ